jgi:hypothetical protein
MKQANPRRANTPMISGAMPAIDDLTLVKRILTLPLGATYRAELEALLPSIEPQKYGQIKKRLRDQLMKLAQEQSLIAKIKPSKGIHVSLSVGYEERRVRGTDIAEAILAWQNPKTGTMPVPPGRRVA